MSEFNDGIEAAADTLWCVHIIGPDDVHAAPNFETAWEWAEAANKMIAAHADERDVLWRCTVAIWPWDAASHAEDAKRGGRNDDIDFPSLVDALKRPEPSEAVPADVRRLVVAARIVAFEDQGPEALRELDQASEAFADLVPWDNEPAVLKAMEQGQ